MRELSGQHTMALPFGVLDKELDLALHAGSVAPNTPATSRYSALGCDTSAKAA